MILPPYFRHSPCLNLWVHYTSEGGEWGGVRGPANGYFSSAADFSWLGDVERLGSEAVYVVVDAGPGPTKLRQVCQFTITKQ